MWLRLEINSHFCLADNMKTEHHTSLHQEMNSWSRCFVPSHCSPSDRSNVAKITSRSIEYSSRAMARVPTFLTTKNSRTFQDCQNVFPGPSLRAIPGCKAYGTPNILKLIIIVVYFEPPVNSSTIQVLRFPVLSWTISFHFQDFSGPNCFSRTFQGLENPGKNPGCVGTLHGCLTPVVWTGVLWLVERMHQNTH